MRFALIAVAMIAAAADAPRILIVSGKSWSAAGGYGGSSPQAVEVMKTFKERCPSVVITSEKDKADYVVLFDREGFKGLARKDANRGRGSEGRLRGDKETLITEAPHKPPPREPRWIHSRRAHRRPATGRTAGT